VVTDEADTLAYRWAWPWRRRFIPSTQESLTPIPGFLDIVEDATTSGWNRFLSQTLPEEMPDWGLWTFGSMLEMAAKLAKRELSGRSLSADTAGIRESLEAIQHQTDTIYGAQLPIMEMVSEAIQTTRKMEQQQAVATPLLDKLVQFIGRPRRQDAERSLEKCLGDVYTLLTAEAKAAAIEAELRFLQGDCVDPSVIPMQFAKAFECQLKASITRPLYNLEKRRRYELSARELKEALEDSDQSVLSYLKQCGIELSSLLSTLERIRYDRNTAAHYARITLVQAEELRADWLGIHDRTKCIFRALMPRSEQ
jgi:hypothetical protein